MALIVIKYVLDKLRLQCVPMEYSFERNGDRTIYFSIQRSTYLLYIDQ